MPQQALCIGRVTDRGEVTPHSEARRSSSAAALGWGLLPRAPRPPSYLIEQLVVESTVYPVDAHVSEE